ncbi:MAG: hypothetical protein V3R57_07275 [Candidatus Bathyarchaeia archaeon]
MVCTYIDVYPIDSVHPPPIVFVAVYVVNHIDEERSEYYSIS